MAPELPDSYPFELGYITTHLHYGGQGHCQTLLRSFMPLVQQKAMFSTTRKPGMVHILKKFGFYKTGQVYKGDLELYLRESK
jgi:predicted GNAT family N-acyltransferase